MDPRIYARLFKPRYTQAVPKGAKVVTIDRKKFARWTQRGGREVTAALSDDGTRCTVEVDYWACEVRNHLGEVKIERCYRDLTASQKKRLEILTRLEREAAGIPMPSATTPKSISELIDAWEKHLRSKAPTDKHVKQTVSRVRKIVEAIGALTPKAISAAAVEDWLAELREQGENFRGQVTGSSVQTSNHYLVAIRSFCGWLVDRNHLEKNPLAKLEKLNADAARAFERRAMTDKELWALINTTEQSTVVRRNLAGPDRAYCYLTAAFTGLRLSELAELTPEAFVKHGKQLRILLPAANQKNRRELPVFIPSKVARRLLAYLKTKAPGERMWDKGGWAKWGYASTAFYADLEDAKVSAELNGKRLDFHALRTHYQTSMLLAGIPLAHATRLARLSSPATLMKHYAKLGLDELAAEVEKLGQQKAK